MTASATPENYTTLTDATGNLRARRAYEKAGFRVEARVVTETGPAVLMLYEPQRATGGLLPSSS